MSLLLFFECEGCALSWFRFIFLAQASYLLLALSLAPTVYQKAADRRALLA